MKLYTVEEAAAALATVVPIVTELRDAFVRLRSLQATIQADSRGASADGHLLADAFAESSGDNEIETLNRLVRQAALRLERLGIEVKDPERGLIDFLHEREGRTVYLCYVLGEPEIGFWHEIHAGFAGRKPL
ncbi:MAG: DUF2203 domain-containing protein [Dehalococcoidia bacterium]